VNRFFDPDTTFGVVALIVLIAFFPYLGLLFVMVDDMLG
jgi:hypothetical protein